MFQHNIVHQISSSLVCLEQYYILYLVYGASNWCPPHSWGNDSGQIANWEDHLTSLLAQSLGGEMMPIKFKLIWLIQPCFSHHEDIKLLFDHDTDCCVVVGSSLVTLPTVNLLAQQHETKLVWFKFTFLLYSHFLSCFIFFLCGGHGLQKCWWIGWVKWWQG